MKFSSLTLIYCVRDRSATNGPPVAEGCKRDSHFVSVNAITDEKGKGAYETTSQRQDRGNVRPGIRNLRHDPRPARGRRGCVSPEHEPRRPRRYPRETSHHPSG